MMKIYLAESENFMAYSLYGDLGQEYASNVYPKEKGEDFNAHEKCLERCIFYIYANRPIHTKRSPEIYLLKNRDVNQIDILKFKDLVTKNQLFKKYIRDNAQSLLIKDLKDYGADDVMHLHSLHSKLEIQEKDLCIKNNQIMQVISSKKQNS